ncbi:MAG: hypothetical protein MUQ30_07250, partial [Anaerolineae bacterium]|nr:hypothetical protein [Anaerolineae bacterium]
QAQAEELEAHEPKRAELANVEAMIAEAEQEAGDIARAMVKASGVVGRALDQEAEAVNMRHEALTRSRVELQEALSVTRITDEAISDTVQFAGDVRLGLENADDAIKRRILELLDVVVVVSDGHFSVRSGIGEWGGEVRRTPSARWNSGIVDSSC